MNKRHYEHTLPNIRGSLSNTYVHRIRIFGNMLPNGKAELTFDVNVVPDADYTRDYEELFQEFNAKNGIVKEMVDGKESELGYYVGTP